jgi:UDP-N-acetylmuramoylalanine--D-glutamate ligase
VADTRAAPPHAEALAREFANVPVDAGPFRAESFAAAEFIAISPGIDRRTPQVAEALARGVPVGGDVELFAQALPARAPRLIAITGTNGKSTVTEMTGGLCAADGRDTIVAGNIGLPVLDALATIEDSGAMPDVFVLELSSFQLESTASLHADAATVLNVTEDHLDRYTGLADYARTKARIFAGGGTQVLNRDDAWSRGMLLPGRKAASFGLDEPFAANAWGIAARDGASLLMRGDTPLLATGELQVVGSHNHANALAAGALAAAIGIGDAAIARGLKAFRGLAHRVENIATVNGVAFYDDSKGTNVGSTVAALAGMPMPVVLIAGGDGKGQDFTPLSDVMGGVRGVVLIGRDRERIAAAIAATGVTIERADSLEDAVTRAYARARETQAAVLLSPACASLDMFRNYLHRAEVFAQAVQGLAGGPR